MTSVPCESVAAIVLSGRMADEQAQRDESGSLIVQLLQIVPSVVQLGGAAGIVELPGTAVCLPPPDDQVV